MQVGCYCFDLYCDGVDCPRTKKFGRFEPLQFTGKTGGECRSNARKAGWRVSAAGDLCPKCRKVAK